MPPKKGFEAFLKKNQKKGTKAKAEDGADAQDSEVKADEQKQNEVKKTPVTKKQNNNSSDDEEEDELDLATK